MLQIDDLVFVRKGFRKNELAVITEVSPEKGKYTAEYPDGHKLRFSEKHINKTVFVVA